MPEPEFIIEWLDHGREPKVAPDPRYPHGVDIDASKGAPVATCMSALPYPARRCGLYMIICRRCGWSGLVSTAGRPDDPRSIKVPCKGSART